jgi:hypothetical protein
MSEPGAVATGVFVLGFLVFRGSNHPVLASLGHPSFDKEGSFHPSPSTVNSPRKNRGSPCEQNLRRDQFLTAQPAGAAEFEVVSGLDQAS